MNDLEVKLRQVPLANPPDSLDHKVTVALADPPRRVPVLALAFAAAAAGLVLTGMRLLAPPAKPTPLPSVVAVPMSPALRAVFCDESGAERSFFQEPRTHIQWITPKGDQTT